MIVGLVKTVDQKSIATNTTDEDAEIEALLAKASYIMNNPSEFDLTDDNETVHAGAAEIVVA